MAGAGLLRRRLIGGQAEQEEVLGPHMLADLDIGAVQRADGQRAVHGELHVAGARGLLPRRADLFGQIRRRDQLFGHRDVVIGRIGDLQQIAGHRVVIDRRGHVVDQVDHRFRQPVARCRLAAEDLDARGPVAVRRLVDAMPQRDRLQHVQKLALVFVHALDLYVEDRIGIDAQPQIRQQPVRQGDLVGALGGVQPVQEGPVPGMGLQPRELVQILGPAGADRLVQKPRQFGIGQPQPAARRHAIGLVHDPVGMQLVQVGKDRVLDQLGMQRRDAVHPAGHDEGQLSHMDLIALHDADMGGAARADAVILVDHLDDLHVAGQHAAHQPGGPALQRFGQKGVVGIVQRAPRQILRAVEGQAVIVHQQADQLGPGNGRMRVVQLDRHLVGQHFQIAMFGHEPCHDVLQRRRGQEIFLLQPQLLARFRRVVGIEHPRQGPGQRLGFRRCRVIARIEALEVQKRRRQRPPQAQAVGPMALPADHRRVMGARDDAFAWLPDGASVHRLDMALEADLVAVVDAHEFPGMGLVQPVLGRLHLLAALEALAEQPVLVADAIAEGRAVQRGERLHETGRQPPQAAIAKRRVGLILQDHLLVQAQQGQRLAHLRLQFQVDDRIAQDAADQELHRQVIDPLGALVAGGADRVDPGADHQVAHGEADRQPPVEDGGEFGAAPLGMGQMVQDLVAQILCRQSLGHSRPLACLARHPGATNCRKWVTAFG